MTANNSLVMHYCHEFSPVSQTFIYDLIMRQSRRKMACAVVTKRKVNSQFRTFNDVTEVGYNRWVSPAKLRAANDIPYVYGCMSQYKKLASTLIDRSPSVIHCHFGWAAIDILEVIQRFDLSFSVLVSLHGTDVNTFPKISRRYKKLLGSYNKTPVLYTVPSLYLKARATEMLGLHPENIRVVPNTFNSDLFLAEGQHNILSKDKEVRLVCIARFIKCKGHSLLVDVIERLVTQGFNVRVELIGDGPELQVIRTKVLNKKLMMHFRFLGALQHNEIPKILSQCDIYIQPSVEDPLTGQVESFGVSVLEGIAAGLPVIVSAVGGLPETVLGGDGMLAQVVKPDVASIVDAITKLMKQSACVDNGDFRDEILSMFDAERNMQLYLDLYSELKQ